MDDLPSDVTSSIVRGLGAYVRAAKVEELPGRLKRFRGYRPQTLSRHRVELLAALEDRGLRGRVLEWLDQATPKLGSRDKEHLRLACARPEGWREQLAGQTTPRKKAASRAASGTGQSRERIEKERALARKAREDARRVKEEARKAIQAERGTIQTLKQQVVELKAQLAAATADARAAHREATGASEQLERERRKARSVAQKSSQEVDKLRKEIRKLRSEVATARPKPTEPRRTTPRPTSARKTTRGSRGPRRPMRAPKGRLQDDPETLEEWLDEPSVKLLIDGYNVTKSRGGFSHLQLEGQRDRLVEAVAKLARAKDVPTIVVFDGSDVAPGSRRRPRGPASVEYSRASETADDHLVALLAKLPPDPVVLVTNDRDLQARAQAQGATIATSMQLLSLIR